MLNLKKRFRNNRVLLIFKMRMRRFKARFKNPIRGNNNLIIKKGVLINTKFDIIGNNNTINIMSGAVLSDMVIIMRGSNHSLIIGERCHIKGGNFYFEDEFCTIQIGKGTTVESAHFAVTEPNKSIIIGEDCMFSYGIEFRTGDSHSIIDLETKKRINYAKDIIIGDHVWIGAKAIILKGVTIGNNSIVGINSIVSSNIPVNTIAAGIPAKIVKENVDWIKERIYDN